MPKKSNKNQKKNIYKEYEQEKKRISKTAVSHEDYENKIRLLCDKLGI